LYEFDKYKKYGAYHWDDIAKDSLKKLFSRSIPTLTRYNKILNAIPNDARKIVDIGCGDGALTNLLAQRIYSDEVFGIDTDKEGIELAKRKVDELTGSEKITFINKSFEDCGFSVNSVDAIVMCDVIEHVEDTHSLLIEIKRVGKPNGVLVLTTPRKRNGMKWDEHHTLEYSEDTLSNMLREYFPKTIVSQFSPLCFYYKYHKLKFFFNALYLIGINPLDYYSKWMKHGMLLGVSMF